MTKGIIYYTDNRLDPAIGDIVRTQLRRTGLPIVCASLQPMDFGDVNIHLPLERGYLTMFKQILAALEASTADVIFFCEHDVVYPLSHFEFTPTQSGTFYYNMNVWKLRLEDNFAVWVDKARQVSGIAVQRETAVRHYRERVAKVEADGYDRDMGFEPGTHGRIPWRFPITYETWLSPDPLVDIRHTTNLTPNRWSTTQFRSKKWCENWTESTCPEWAVPLIYPNGAPTPPMKEAHVLTVDRIFDYYQLDPTGISDRTRTMPIEIPNITRDKLGDLFRFLGFREGAEVGVERGEFSERLLVSNPHLTLHSIDAWQSHKGYRDHVSQEKLDGFYEATVARLRDVAGDRSIIHRGFSTDVAKEFADASLDFVYIDANHDLPNTIADIHAWSPKVRRGGILAGHDYIRRKTRSRTSAECHVVDAVHAWTTCYDVYPWFVLGRRSPVEPDEIRERSRSWMWVKA